MKAIVVGGNGYLGQNLSIHLLRKDVKVISVDVHERCMLGLYDEKFQYTSLNITDKKCAQLFNWDADVVFFLAGRTGTKASIESAAEFTLVNQVGLINVLSAIVHQGSRSRIVFPSTRLVYKGSPHPLNESSEIDLKTIYALNKLSCEKSLEIYSSFYNLEYTVLRICVPYGSIGSQASSYGTIGFMHEQAKKGAIQLFGDGSQRRTFVHVGDIVDIMFAVAGDSRFANQVFNIGGEDFSLHEVAALIAGRTGAKIEFQEWPAEDLILESGDTVFDSGRLDSLLSYNYKYNFRAFIQNI